MSKVVKLDYDGGTLEVSLTVVGHVNGRSESDTGYKDAVAEAHFVLDQLDIPSPTKGQPCSLGDPSCKSALGHRVRELRARYLVQLNLLRSIEQNPERAAEILTRHNH